MMYTIICYSAIENLLLRLMEGHVLLNTGIIYIGHTSSYSLSKGKIGSFKLIASWANFMLDATRILLDMKSNSFPEGSRTTPPAS